MRKLRQQYRLLIAAAAGLLLVAGIVFVRYSPLPWLGQGGPGAAIDVTVAPVSMVSKPVRLVRTGFVGSAETIPVNTEYAGRLSELYVSEGQPVKTGQALFKLEAVSGTAGAAGETQKEGVSSQQQGNYDNALKKFNSYQKLYELGAVSRRELERAEAALQEARESLSAGRSSSSGAVIPNGTAVIKAPVDGVVTRLYTASGKTVQAGQQLLALGSGQEVEIVLSLEQNDLYLVRLGTPAMIEVQGRTVMGQVSSIRPEVEEEKVAFFLAHIKLTDAPDTVLELGTAVNGRIDTGKTEAVIAVPSGAVLQDEQGGCFVYTATGGKAVRQPVGIGERIGEFTEITSNLSQGMMVITSNTDQLNNGDVITIRE